MKKKSCCCTVSYIALILVIIGALNWGLWGFFQFDFIAWIFRGDFTIGARIIYCLIGLSGLWSLRFLGCKHERK